MGTCLAATHRLLGPIVAIQSQLQSLKNGDYASRVYLRAGHPLTRVAKDLNDLGETLRLVRPTEPVVRAIPQDDAAAGHAENDLEHLLAGYARPNWGEAPA